MIKTTLPEVYVITATCGRHYCIERSVGFFLDQDYEGIHTMLIYNNSDVAQSLHLPDLPPNKRVRLINSDSNLVTHTRYQSLGEIYNDAITFIPSEVEVISFWDDDDIFLPNHISAGVKGLIACGKTAYKPSRSYYRHSTGISLVQNTLEPSIFVDAQHIKNYGFSLTTSDQHHEWLSKLGDEMFVDPMGEPTLVYNWGDHNVPTFKTSGDPGNPKNFDNYRNFSQDHGDCIIQPWKENFTKQYYNQVQSLEHI